MTFPYSDSNKRFHTLNYTLRREFGRKVIKLSVNGGFTCPNKDGTRGVGGCIYCSPSGSGDFGGNPAHSISAQLAEVRQALRKKWDDALYIAYFQANTGTYAPLERLKALYEEALAAEAVVGLSISTRPDCISDETADYLAQLSERTYLTVELGLQTVHDSTAALINRCHTYGDFLLGLEKLRSRGLRVCVHIIDGLPHETHEMMLETTRAVAGLGVYGVKIHLLQILRGTVLAEMYLRGEFPAMEKEEYISTVCDQLELLPPEITIERLTGDGDRKLLAAPRWCLDKRSVLNGIDREMARRNAFQGDLCKSNSKA